MENDLDAVQIEYSKLDHNSGMSLNPIPVFVRISINGFFYERENNRLLLNEDEAGQR